MTQTLDTVRAEIPRDRFGRPLVVPPDGGKRVAYTRCTTYVDCLEDRYRLELWQQRNVAVGMSMRHDLVLAAAAHRNDKDKLDEIAKAAREASADSAAATTGTALHRMAQDLDSGVALADLPASAQADLDAYAEATRRITPVLIERFCVLDDLRIGGTPDRIAEVDLPGYDKPVVVDIKTGNVEYGIGKIAMQLAVYAHANALYDPATEARTTPPAVDQERALVVSLPAGSGTCELIEVDIATGWRAVDELAGRVRAWRRLKFKDLARRVEVVDNAAAPKTVEPAGKPAPTLADKVADARSADELTALWREHAHEWTSEHTELAKARKALLAGKLTT